MKKGLVLEGGAMRGMFTAGILDVFLENNIEFDGMIGVSAGATFGCSFKSKQHGRTIRYNKKYCNDKRYWSLRSLIKTGNLFGVDFCYRLLPEELDVFDIKAYDENPMEFYLVCTDIETGKPIYKQFDKMTEDYLEWMRASASLPLAATIVEVGGYKLLDGGISDSIPLGYFNSIGYEKNIVILTQPRDYVKEKNKAMPFIKRNFKKYPKLIEAVADRHNMYNREREYVFQSEKEKNTLVLCPLENLPINHTEKNPDVLQKVYDMGRNAAIERLEEIKEFLKG